MQRRIALALLLACAPETVVCGSMEQALAKLAPEERSHQACILKGLEVVRRDPRLRRADRMKTSILTPAVLQGTTLAARGGAVRSGDRWYSLSFTCSLTENLMKATSFAFVLGEEIPRQRWDDLGLWQ